MCTIYNILHFFYLVSWKSLNITQDIRNILWITCEGITITQGSYGDPVAFTPNLDKLASAGIQFNKADLTAVSIKDKVTKFHHSI